MTDGQTDRTDGRTDRRTDGRTDRQTEGRTDGQTDGQTEGRTGGQKNRQAEGQTDRETHRRTNRRTDGRTDRQTEGQTDRQTTVPYAVRVTKFCINLCLSYRCLMCKEEGFKYCETQRINTMHFLWQHVSARFGHLHTINLKLLNVCLQLN
jgi:hypothetical protein